MRNKFLLFESHPDYGMLLQQSEQTNTIRILKETRRKPTKYMDLFSRGNHRGKVLESGARVAWGRDSKG